MTGLRRVLIGNRGEIAIRIAKAAAALGRESVGVYTRVDALSLHTRFTTEARELGSHTADVVSAYRDAQALIRTARAAACDCVHPGYGFLSENAHFAERCASAGLTFVGPPSPALALCGDKLRARLLAQSLAIPIVPGSTTPLTSPDEAAELARELGYPVGHRLGQPARQRRRADRGRVQQAEASPRPVRRVSPACPQPDRQSGLCRGSGARNQRHNPAGRRGDGRLRSGRCPHLHRADAAQLWRGREQLRHTPVTAVGAGRLAGRGHGRDSARGRH